MLLRALILVKSGCFTDRETLHGLKREKFVIVSHTLSVAYQELVANFSELSHPDIKQVTKFNNLAETAVPTMLLNVCELPLQRRSLRSLLTGFGVPVPVRVPAVLSP